MTGLSKPRISGWSRCTAHPARVRARVRVRVRVDSRSRPLPRPNSLPRRQLVRS